MGIEKVPSGSAETLMHSQQQSRHRQRRIFRACTAGRLWAAWRSSTKYEVQPYEPILALCFGTVCRYGLYVFPRKPQNLILGGLSLAGC
jgi:hypothetical protein